MYGQQKKKKKKKKKKQNKRTKTKKNIIDGNVQLRVHSHILDNFQGVTEIVFDR